MESFVTDSIARQSNWEALRRTFHTASAERGDKLLTMTPEARETILQSHLLRSPSQEAIEDRDGLDYLLRYYSVLEIAALLDVIPQTLPTEFAVRARQLLEDVSVRRYYERFYPLLLPQLFRDRLAGRPLGSKEQHSLENSLVLSRFIEVSALRDNAETDMLLWFLDDGKVYDGGKEHGIREVLAVINKPAELIRRLSPENAHRSPTDIALLGFFRFLRFSRELFSFLNGIAEMPILQSACWHFHGYWYEQLGGQTFGVIAAGIESYRKYAPTSTIDSLVDDLPLELRDEQSPKAAEKIRSAIRETHVSMDTALDELTALTSGLYRVALEAVVLERRGLFRPKGRTAQARTASDGYEGIAVGETYTGSVTAIYPYGVFVSIAPGVEGLVRVTELAHDRVEPTDLFKRGDLIEVQVISIVDNRIRLSRRALLSKSGEDAAATFQSVDAFADDSSGGESVASEDAKLIIEEEG